MSLRTLYPEITPHQTGYLSVTPPHKIYWEESGNPQGTPVLFLHGGPGRGTNSSHRRFFHPEKYRIILFDQRGCGKSTPYSCLENNTTWDLVQDIEALRQHLDVDRWLVFGGSWGSTLALTYAISHPAYILGLILRGIFLCRPSEIFWFYQSGAHHLFPDEWEHFIAPLSLPERENILLAYHQRLNSPCASTRQQAVQAWVAWEGSTIHLKKDVHLFAEFTNPEEAEALARLENHYFIHRSFFPSDNWILENASALRSIPGRLIHGRYDIVCPLESAWQLHKAWPEADLNIIPAAGHAGNDPAILDALIRATDHFIDNKTKTFFKLEAL